MCYSARIAADHRRYSTEFGATLSLKEFVDLFWHRRNNPRMRVPRGLESAFLDSPEHGDEWTAIRTAIADDRAAQAQAIERELFVQLTRLTEAERSLAARETKKALESRRIATSKIVRLRERHEALAQHSPARDDSRIFPGSFAPVMVWADGRRVIRPMRYQCRPAGKPADYDTRFPGTYNARRDSLDGFWRRQFGHNHAVIMVDSFFENVERDGRHVVLEFDPRPSGPLYVACLWSHWHGPGEDLLSFAMITDEPPPEVAAAGHDRCIIALRPEQVDPWLRASEQSRERLRAILDERPAVQFDHRLAA